ncbi:MAG: GDSL family lipase [Clostridia bacterium]|jgi:lysophospholipase L1-like esterase|nr:GDSL family lipase [Clostridia bacterium]
MLFICLGDSITYGYPYGPAFSWVSLSQDSVNVELVNKGHNGDTIGDMLARFQRDVLALKPTDVLVLGGTNDAWNRIPLKSVREQLASMLHLANTHNIRFHLGLPIPINIHSLDDPFLDQAIETAPYLESYRNWMRQYAAQNKFDLIDFYTPMLSSDGTGNPDYYVDSGHPNHKGYQIMATTMIGYLQNANLA